MTDKTPGGKRPGEKITRDDLEARFRALAGDVEHTKAAAQERLRTIAIVGGVAVLAVVFLLGQRRGKRKTTIVEVRRF